MKFLKSYLWGLLALVSSLAIAQQPLAVYSQPTPEIIATNEGRLVSNSIFGGDAGIVNYGSSSTITAGTLQQPLKTWTVPAGRIFELHSIDVMADQDCIVLVRINAQNNNLSGVSTTDLGTYEQHWRLFPSGGGTQTIHFAKGKYLNEYTNIGLFYWRKGTGAVAAPFVDASVNGLDLTGDRNLKATNVLLVLGDSYTHTNSGNIYGQQYWPFVLRDSLASNGLSVRLVNKGFGSALATTAAPLIRTGWIDFPFDKVAVCYGFNDASVTPSVWAATQRAAYKQSMKDIIDEIKRTAKRYRKNPSIILFKPYTPKSTDANRTANIADCRTALQEVKDTYFPNDSKVVIGDLSGLYTDAAFTADNVHVGANPGHLQIGNAAFQKAKSTGWLTNNMGLWLLLFLPIRRRYRHN